MKKLLFALLIAGTAIAHVPVITPSDTPDGDRPPRIGPKPLPPVIYIPVTQVPIVIIPW